MVSLLLSKGRNDWAELLPGVYDRKRAIHDMAKNEDVDVITGESCHHQSKPSSTPRPQATDVYPTGDWMSECNMTLRGSDKRDRLAKKKMSSGSTVVAKCYEPYFLEELEPAIPWLAKNGIKVAVNAGASDVHGLATEVKALVEKHGVDLKVGIVDGDDVTDSALELYARGTRSLPGKTRSCADGSYQVSPS